MATKIVEEYYANCPNCGGVSKDGDKVCDYCGTSLLKTKTVQEYVSYGDVEAQQMRQYQQATAGMADGMAGIIAPIFLMLFGIGFVSVPLSMILSTIRFEQAMGGGGMLMGTVVFEGVFVLIGLGVFAMGLLQLIRFLKNRKNN